MVRKDSYYNKTELSNGIRVVTEKIPNVRSVSIGMWLTVGSRDERVENNGIAHYTEHMMFKGTTRLSASDIAQSLERVGGYLNAFTGKEVTCYYAHVLNEHISNAVEILGEILTDSVFDEVEMEKEKRVILDELSNIEEMPEELLHDLFWEDLFPDHPLGMSIIGKRDTVSDIDRSKILDFIDRNYTSDRIVVAAAGDVDHQDLVELLGNNVAKLKRGPHPSKYPLPNLPDTKVNVVENGAIQAHVCLGTQAYNYRDRKKFALLVLNTLLGSGMSSRLFQNIREKHGIAYSIYSFVDFLFNTGVFGIYLGTDKENVERSLELIQDELQMLTRNSVSVDELERTKSQLKGNLMLGLEGTSSRMNRLAKMEIYLGDYFTLDDTIKEIDAVDRRDLHAIAVELFDENRLHTTILKPKAN